MGHVNVQGTNCGVLRRTKKRFLPNLFNKQRLAVVSKLFIDNRQKATALHTVVRLNAYSIEYRGRNIHTTAKRLAALAVGTCRRVAPDEWHGNQTGKVKRSEERRVGNEGVGSGRSRWWPYQKTKIK